MRQTLRDAPTPRLMIMARSVDGGSSCGQRRCESASTATLSCMERVDKVLDDQSGLATRSQLRAAGFTDCRVRSRLHNGSWQLLLPGVILAQTGPTSPAQWRIAGLLYAGSGAVLSHRTAADLHGLRIAVNGVDVLVPHGRRVRSHGPVLVHQTNQRIEPVLLAGQPCTPIARTVIDVGLASSWLDDVRAVVSDSVQRRLTTVGDLQKAAETMPRRCSRWVTTALEELAAGARSAGEGVFLRLVRDSDLPEPELNARVRTGAGDFFVDALWRRQRVAAEIDGQAYHLGAAQWAKDLRRQNLVVTSGLWVLRFPVRRLRVDPAGVVGELRAALRS